MLFRTPGRTFLTVLTLTAAYALHLRPAVLEDAAAFRTALANFTDSPASSPSPAAPLTLPPDVLAGAPAPDALRPEPPYARFGVALQPLIFRDEPGEEPALPPEDLLPEDLVDTAVQGGADLPFLHLSNPLPPPAEAAYAALEAGALDAAADLFEQALDHAASGQLAADLAYTRLRLGQRREAARAFEAALRLGAATPEAGALWQQEARRLNDRVSLQAYTFLREGSGAPAAFGVAAPGQSQSALLLQVRPDPLAEHPLIFVGRLLAAHHGPSDSPFRRSTQATAGVGWVAVPALGGTMVAERWFRMGEDSRNAWALRLHGGHGEGYGPVAGEALWPHWSVYGEAAVIGTRRRDLYAGGEARAGWGYALGPQARATLTAALWGQIQHDDITRHRVEAGPSLGLDATLGALPVQMRLDYRLTLDAAHAAGSSTTFTLAAGF